MADDKDQPGDPGTAVPPTPGQSMRAPPRAQPRGDGDITPEQGELLYTEALEGAGLPAGPGDDHTQLVDFRTGSHQRFEVSAAIEHRRDEAAAASAVHEAEDNAARSTPAEPAPSVVEHDPARQQHAQGETEARRRRDELDTANDNQVEPAPELLALHARGAKGRAAPDGPEAATPTPGAPSAPTEPGNTPQGPQGPQNGPAGPETDRKSRNPEPEAPRWSIQRGDVPEEIAARYMVETGRNHAFYFDHRQRESAFQDAGSRLHTQANAPRVITDMVGVAKHRGWSEIQVKGSIEFRQEAWLEARVAGLGVRGYSPTERDLQELDRRRTPGENTLSPAQAREQRAPAGPEVQGNGRRTPPGSNGRTQPTPAADRIDYSEGVTGKLLDAGSAPYQNRDGARPTPYITLELGSGRKEQVWGVGLPEALQRSGRQVGDDVTVRKEAVRSVEVNVPHTDPVTGERSFEKTEVNRNTWAVEAAERFRALSPSERARDPDLKAAQSQFTAISARLSEDVPDPKLRAQVIAELKEDIAQGLAEGQAFRPAMMQETQVQARAPDLELAQPTRGAPERER